MPPLTLVMGPKNYSSWSVRPWLALKQAGLAFDEITIGFEDADAKEQIRRYSPSGTVPVLLQGDRAIWVSLAICEYVAELAPNAKLWPEDREARGHARSVSGEMVGGFSCLRMQMPMNARARYPGKGMGPGVEEVFTESAKSRRECRERYGSGGDFLYGSFTIADAMYAPVVSRFVTYRVQLGPQEQAYVDAVLAHPPVQEWYALAKAETVRLEEYERPFI